jgi:LacI family transcriptional regulator
MKTSLTSIAKAIGVSITTVHDALYDCGRVHPETRAKIKAMAQQLGYRPNRLAQALRSQRSGLLGVVLGGSVRTGVSFGE